MGYTYCEQNGPCTSCLLSVARTGALKKVRSSSSPSRDVAVDATSTRQGDDGRQRKFQANMHIDGHKIA